MQNLQPFIDSLQNFAQKRLGFEHPPKLFLKQDAENAKDVFGKTAYYDPNEKSITIFTTGRHPKDILRSIAHELVHHCQNLRGDLSPEKCGEMGIGYAQQNDHMREMEREAYEKGNLCFRDWEDGIKVAIQKENNQLKENKKMVKISKKELKGLIGKLLEARMQKEQTEELEEENSRGMPPSLPGQKGRDDEFLKNIKKKKEKETQRQAQAGGVVTKEEVEELDEGEVKNPGKYKTGMEAGYDDDGDGVPNGDDKSPKDGSTSESKIQTPEQEKILYESRFNKRNEEIFDKLKKLWTK